MAMQTFGKEQKIKPLICVTVCARVAGLHKHDSYPKNNRFIMIM